MITKNSLILLLSELADQGIDTTMQISKTAMSSSIPLDVI